MAQPTIVSNDVTDTDYTFNSTTDATTMTVSNDAYAEVLVWQDVAKALREVASALRALK